MRRAIFLITCATALIYTAFSQVAPAPANASLGAQAAGRIVFRPDGLVELIGYFTFIEGVNSPLFDGTPSERTAHFTLRTEGSGIDYIPNGNLMHLFARPQNPAGTQVNIYYNANPNQDFNRPETFNDGQLIAVYQAGGTRASVIPARDWSVATQLRLSPSETPSIPGLPPLPGLLHVSCFGLSLQSFSQFLELRGAGGLSVPYGASIYYVNDRR